jgi:hypothetical protein
MINLYQQLVIDESKKFCATLKMLNAYKEQIKHFANLRTELGVSMSISAHNGSLQIGLTATHEGGYERILDTLLLSDYMLGDPIKAESSPGFTSWLISASAGELKFTILLARPEDVS